MPRVSTYSAVQICEATTQSRWPVREVARQIDSGLFERVVLNPPKISTALGELHPAAASQFKDADHLEFLTLPSARTCRAPAPCRHRDDCSTAVMVRITEKFLMIG